MKKIRIAVITGPGVPAAGIKQAVGEQAGDHAVFRARNPFEAEYFCRLLSPRLILLHWESLMDQGPAFVEHLLKTCSGCRIIVLAADRRQATEALNAQASGYVLLSSGWRDSSIEKVIRSNDFNLWKTPARTNRRKAPKGFQSPSSDFPRPSPFEDASGISKRPAVIYRGLKVDFQSRTVEKDDQPISLTYLEFRLLEYMMERPETVVTYEELLRNVWRYKEPAGAADVVKACIYRLRRKIGVDTTGRHYISNIRKVGYIFGGGQ